MSQRSSRDAKQRRLVFGPNKYYAISLVLARWLRHYAVANQEYCYVTLGGTELRDVANVLWIDELLGSDIISYENDSGKAGLARQTAASMARKGLAVSIIEGDIFSYERSSDVPHIFFVDLMGICKPIPYEGEFRDWLGRDVLRAGDFLLVTSYLGRQELKLYDPEFRELRSFRYQEKRKLYDRCHPAFVLRRALLSLGLERELRLRPVGSIRYRDSSSMGLYGILVEEGDSNLRLLVEAVPFYNTRKAVWQ